MSLAASFWGNHIPELVIGFAALSYVVRQVLELTGRAPGAERLRRENEDLVRREKELEATIARHEEQIADLKLKVAQLEMTNQAAVLDALVRHETNAGERFKKQESLLRRAVEALESPASTARREDV